MTLEQFFRENRKAAVAFSGGTDSAFLLWTAKKYGCDVRAYYVKTAFQPAFELQDARRLAGELDVPMTELPVEILEVPEAADNGQERCYYCKKALFTRLREAAKQDGFSLLLDGTNASDDAGDRPGMRALEEFRVRSPLRECGMTKDEVRKSSKQAGRCLPGISRHMPALQPDLSTRICREDLKKVERAEEALAGRSLDFRCACGEAARIQVTEQQMALLLLERKRC